MSSPKQNFRLRNMPLKPTIKAQSKRLIRVYTMSGTEMFAVPHHASKESITQDLTKMLDLGPTLEPMMTLIPMDTVDTDAADSKIYLMTVSYPKLWRSIEREDDEWKFWMEDVCQVCFGKIGVQCFLSSDPEKTCTLCHPTRICTKCSQTYAD